MTTKEFRSKIAESEQTEWYNAAELSINYSHINFKNELTGFSSIHQFLSQQIKGWSDLSENLPNEFTESQRHFETLRIRLETFVNNNRNSDENTLTRNWQSEQSTFKQNRNYFTYDSPQSKFLIDIKDNVPDAYIGAYKYIVGTFELNTKEKLIGNLLAYEYDLKDHTEITNRRNSEKSSISKIRNDLRKQLSESEIHLTEHLSKASGDYKNYVGLIDTFKSEKEILFDKWFDKSKGDFDNFDLSSKGKIDELEKTYREKLKLEAPARYWQVKSAKYYEEGKKARNILLWMVSLTGIFLAIILVVSPAWIFKQVFSENTSSIVRWSVVFIVLLSFIAFAVRAITKVMFSSYHLARDAEERHTLTFFYLALLKDTEVKEEERKLILQSLFSRVDTGLLKEDSGPTMPNDISKIIGK